MVRLRISLYLWGFLERKNIQELEERLIGGKA